MKVVDEVVDVDEVEGVDFEVDVLLLFKMAQERLAVVTKWKY